MSIKINKKRGEFEVFLDNKQIVIVPSLLNIAEWEEETGKHWLQHTQTLSMLMIDRDKHSELLGHIKAKDIIQFFKIFSKEEIGEVKIAEMIDDCDLIEVALQYAVCAVRAIGSKKQAKMEEEAEKKLSETKGEEKTT